MSNLLELGTDWLRSARAQWMSDPVTYRRGTDQVEINAAVGETTFEHTAEDGTVQDVHLRDYLFSVDDLILGGMRTKPLPGDEIEETRGDGIRHTYVVAAVADEPAWVYSDPYRKSFRVHTKTRTTAADAPAATAAYLREHADGHRLYVEFSRDLTEAVLDASNWSLIQGIRRLTGTVAQVSHTQTPPEVEPPAHPRRTVLVILSTTGTLAEGPASCAYSPPPFDVLSLDGVRAKAFSDLSYSPVS